MLHVLSECQKSPRGPGPVTNDPDLLLLSFPEGAGDLRVPWLQGKPMTRSSSKPTSCCSTFPLHPAPEAPRGVASSSACQFGDKPPLLRLPWEENLIVVGRECSIPDCCKVTSAGGHRGGQGGETLRWSHTSKSKLLKMTLLASCQLPTSPAAALRALGWPEATSHPAAGLPWPRSARCGSHPFPTWLPSLPSLTELPKRLGQLCLLQGAVSSLQIACPSLGYEGCLCNPRKTPSAAGSPAKAAAAGGALTATSAQIAALNSES